MASLGLAVCQHSWIAPTKTSNHFVDWKKIYCSQPPFKPGLDTCLINSNLYYLEVFECACGIDNLINIAISLSDKKSYDVNCWFIHGWCWLQMGIHRGCQEDWWHHDDLQSLQWSCCNWMAQWRVEQEPSQFQWCPNGVCIYLCETCLAFIVTNHVQTVEARNVKLTRMV